MYRSVGLDIFLTTALHGQGLGREALRLAIAHYLERGHHRFTIDPAADNERAIRTYAAVGFKPVGRMRDYELGADGTWHDGLLMDLLAASSWPDDARTVLRTRSRTSPRGRGARRPRRRPSSGCG